MKNKHRFKTLPLTSTVTIPIQAFKIPELYAREVFFYMFLQDEDFYPSTRYLSRLTGLSVNSVRKGIDILLKRGIIVHEANYSAGRWSNKYAFTNPNGWLMENEKEQQ